MVDVVRAPIFGPCGLEHHVSRLEPESAGKASGKNAPLCIRFVNTRNASSFASPSARLPTRGGEADPRIVFL
jgi:hypothetical protein